MAEVIALAGWPPEVLAYAFAKYSRSPLSIKQSIQAITAEKSSRFLEDFYFQFGHRSIADNAHVPLALENISEIAAFALEDEQLWDGSERSTRFQNFGEGGYYVPASVQGTPLESAYTQGADFLLGQYKFFSTKSFDWLVKKIEKPVDMKQDVYERILKARAFDVARYWLFSGMLTSVGQITSARTLEGQISRLMSSEYPELQELGQKMKEACIGKPFCPGEKDEPPVAPTLVKYAAPNPFQIALRNDMRREAIRLLGLESQIMKSVHYVRLAPFLRMEDEIISTLLYEASRHPYHEIISLVYSMDKREKKRIIELALSHRKDHDPLPRAFAAGHKIQFDVVMDRGGERDLHRHRNCIQIHQELNTERGWDVPPLVYEMGLADVYNSGMAQAGKTVRELSRKIGVNANYLIPFGYHSATLYKMDFGQAAYMIELRSKPQGHFSYREVVCQMYSQLIKRFPILDGRIRVTPFNESNLLIR